MALTSSEIQSLRYHLGYGAIGIASPYLPDTFLELFRDVVAPNLETGTSTTSATSVAAAGTATIVVLNATDITARTRLVVDVGDKEETVTVRAVSGTSITADFANTHTSTPYPVAIESGETRLRSLLSAADAAHTKMTATTAIDSAGLKRAEDIEWYPDGMTGIVGGVIGAQLRAYRQIVMQLSSLVRVQPVWATNRATGVETY
jgi:hypothetical protein